MRHFLPLGLLVALLMPRWILANETLDEDVVERIVQFQPAQDEARCPALFRLAAHEFVCRETTAGARTGWESCGRSTSHSPRPSRLRTNATTRSTPSISCPAAVAFTLA